MEEFEQWCWDNYPLGLEDLMPGDGEDEYGNVVIPTNNLQVQEEIWFGCLKDDYKGIISDKDACKVIGNILN